MMMLILVLYQCLMKWKPIVGQWDMENSHIVLPHLQTTREHHTRVQTQSNQNKNMIMHQDPKECLKLELLLELQ